MSTKYLEEALDLLAEDPAENYATLLAARDELAAIRAAAVVINNTVPVPAKPIELEDALDLMDAIAKEAS